MLTRWKWGLGLAVIAMGAVALALLLVRPAPPSDLIQANGQIRGTEVTLSTRIPGLADVVAAREGDEVQSGQLIVQIAAAELEARLAQARAQAAAAQGAIAELDAQARALSEAVAQAGAGARITAGITSHALHQAQESLARANAEIAAVQAQASQDAAAYDRFEQLLSQGFVSRNYLDEVGARRRASEARLSAAQRAAAEAQAGRERAAAATGEVEIRTRDISRLTAERQRVEAAKATASSQADAARAGVRALEAQLSDTRVVSPVRATVMTRTVQPGELVAAGRPLMTLVDLGDLYVRVFVSERDVGRLRVGQGASIAIDALAGRRFQGTVGEIAQQAEFTPKDVHMKDEREKLVFAVKVRVANPERLLKPGMPADVTIKAVPNGG